VHQEDGWQADIAKALAKMQAAWVLEAIMQQSADKGQTVSALHHSAVMARKWDHMRQRQDVSGRKKALRSILALHPLRLLF
jgi:hypothetical protein